MRSWHCRRTTRSRALLITLVASVLFSALAFAWSYVDGDSVVRSGGRALLQAVVFGVLWGPAMWWLVWREDRQRAG